MSRPGQHGFSLASLFIITTVCATLVSGLGPLIHLATSGHLSLQQLLVAMGLGLVCGGLLGATIGLHRYHWVRGSAIGGGIGAAIGLVTAPLALLPGRFLPPVATAMFIGSALLVGVAVVLRPGRGAE